MRLLFYQSLPSTQSFLCEKVRAGELTEDTAVWAARQTRGLGSRTREGEESEESEEGEKDEGRESGRRGWVSGEGNLLLSLARQRAKLPSDLPLQSVSLYFAFILRELLGELGSALWLKWPNDLYLGDKKIGGALSAKIKDFIIFGVGVNVNSAPAGAGILDIEVDLREVILGFLARAQEGPSWAEVLKKYMLDFEKSRGFKVHFQGPGGGFEGDLREAILCEDGAVKIGDKKFYNGR